MIFSCLLSALLLFTAPLDSVGNEAGGKSNRNMMLNAESATVPREINIGLPDNGSGAAVYLDGTKASYALPRGHYHWAGGNAYESVGMLSLMESVIRTGQIGVMVDSRTRLGGEVLEGRFTGTSSSNGLIRFDAAVSGPLHKADGWFFSAGAYLNYDPTNVNAPSRYYIEQKQIYQGSLSRRWERASFDAIYRISRCNDNVDGGYSSAPFIYNGDGSIRLLKGFRLGKDCYFPAEDAVSFMDIRTGAPRSGRLGSMDERTIHDITLSLKGRTRSDWNLTALMHACIMPDSQEAIITLAGLQQTVTPVDGFSLNGSPWTQPVQKRLVTVDNCHSTDVELMLKAERSTRRHTLRSGLSLLYIKQAQAGSTFNFAHTVEASPKRLLYGGQASWNFNTNSIYYDGERYQAFLYAIDDWRVGDRLTLRTGARIKPTWQQLVTAARLSDDETTNIRVSGFNLADPSLCQLHHMHIPTFDYSFSEHASYRIKGRLFGMTEGFYSLTSKALKYFRGSSIPSTKPIGIAMVRGGVTYDNEWMDVALLASYITSWDDASIIQVTNSAGTQTITWTAQFGIRTPGLTFDGNLHRGDFNLHTLLTWQDPRYHSYTNRFRFDDGEVKTIDYTGNHVTGISQVMLELDPSYRWKRFQIWASARYFSRQYVSRTNLAWFNGHWETFAGASCQVSGRTRLSVNLVNLLGQSGAKGSINAVDTITDPAALKDLTMSGSYIRPFTVDLSLSVRL